MVRFKDLNPGDVINIILKLNSPLSFYKDGWRIMNRYVSIKQKRDIITIFTGRVDRVELGVLYAYGGPHAGKGFGAGFIGRSSNASSKNGLAIIPIGAIHKAWRLTIATIPVMMPDVEGGRSTKSTILKAPVKLI